MQKCFIKLATVLVLIVLFSCTRKPEGFVIDGTVTGFADSVMLYLQDPDTQENIDSSYIIDGKFQFKGNLTEPKRLYVNNKFTSMETYRYTSFFVENSEIQLTGDYNDFRYCQVMGSESQDIENLLVEKVKDIDKERDSLIDIYYAKRHELGEEEQNNLYNRVNILDSLNDSYRVWLIKNYTNSYAALEKLKYRMTETPKDSLQKIYEMLNDTFKNTQNARNIKTYIDSRLVEIGEPFIDFEAVDINGDPFKLSEVKKDYILLDFWAAGCGPCRMANKELAKHYNELKDNLEIISFSLDMKKEWMEKASAEDSIQWVNVSDQKGFNSIVAIQYKIRGIPCSFLINKERVVVKQFLGYSPELVNKIKKAMAQS